VSAPARTIRPAGAADLGSIAEIYAHYVEQTYITFDLDAPTREQWQTRWETALADNHPWLVCERDGAVVGYATSSSYRPKPAYATTVETTVYLVPGAAGEGLGRALYSALIELLRERAFHSAVALIALPNAASVGLHEALGFRAAGLLTEVGHKLGDWRDVGYWQLHL
jgi:L-amino acid N-acyltransferase YncA